MKILALELSSGRGSIALMGNGAELFTAEFANDRKHSGLFFENLQRAVAQFGRAERIVVGLGPGSYAGTRIAIAAAIGLQTATAAELVGLPSLCAMPTEEREYAIVGDARRQSFFFARVQERRCVEGPLLYSQDELRQRLDLLTLHVFAAETLAAFPEVMVKYPSARILAELAANEQTITSPAPLEPIYLREPHITQPRAVAT